MSEIFFIFFQLAIFFIIFYIPLATNKVLIKKIGLDNLNQFDLVTISIVAITSLFLICSYININTRYFINLLVFLSLSIFAFNIYQNFIKNKNVNKNVNKKFFFIIGLYLASLIFLFFFIANNLKFGWDSLAHWFWKVQVFYQGGSLSEFKNIPNGMYPHLGTYIWSAFWNYSNTEYEYLGRFYFIFFYITVLFSIINDCQNSYKNLFLIFLPFLVFDHQALSGYQDILIFSLTAAIGRFFYLLKEKKVKEVKIIPIIVMSLILLPWCKQEGIFISLILLGTFLVCFDLKFLHKLYISIAVLMFYFLYIYSEIYYKGFYGFHEPIRNSNLLNKYPDILSLLSDILTISNHLLIGFFKRPIFLVSILAGLYLFFYKKKDFLKHNYLLVFFVVHTIYIYTIYLYSSFGLDILPMTLGRLLLQTSGFYLVMLLIVYKKKYENKKRAL